MNCNRPFCDVMSVKDSPSAKSNRRARERPVRMIHFLPTNFDSRCERRLFEPDRADLNGP
jgi:hypothetical protein